MDSVQGLGGVLGSMNVQERAAGGRGGSAEAFRRALQQQGEQAADGQQTPPEPAIRPVRTGLQRHGDSGRRDGEATAGHVDVIA
jgi:hypothetical protein